MESKYPKPKHAWFHGAFRRKKGRLQVAYKGDNNVLYWRFVKEVDESEPDEVLLPPPEESEATKVKVGIERMIKELDQEEWRKGNIKVL